jgi:hypothetical protein
VPPADTVSESQLAHRIWGDIISGASSQYLERKIGVA